MLPARKCRASRKCRSNDGSDDGRLGGADQITDDRLPVGDAVEVKVLAQRQPSRHLGKRGRFANGGDQSHAVLDTGRGAVAESLGRRDVVLGQGWQAKMTCDGTHSRIDLTRSNTACVVLVSIGLVDELHTTIRRMSALNLRCVAFGPRVN